VTRIRTLAAAGLLLPLSGVGLLLAATPAYAAGIVSPGNGVTFTSDQTIRIRADISTTTRTELRLKSPVASSPEQVVDSGAGTLTNNNATLDYDLQTDCATYPSASCSGRAPAPNGTWTVRLSGGASGTSTFVLRIPPRTPASVAARAEGYRAVVISWTKGDEPDLVGWTLYGDGGVLQDLIGLDSCSGTSCSTTVTYASDGTGGHTYALSARRSVEPGSSETVESARSGEVSATLDAPPPPSPEPASGGGSTDGGTTGSGSTGGSTGGSSGGSTGGSTGGSAGGTTGGTSSATGGSTGGTTGTSAAGSSSGISTSSKPAAAIAQRRAFALTFKAFGPKLGIPKLPPLPATSKPAVAPLPDGTYEKTLGYKEVVKREKVSIPQAAATRVTGAVGSALDSDHFMRSLAGGLVLLLCAAHLRRWLGSTHHEP
jgi:hypothetical protein